MDEEERKQKARDRAREWAANNRERYLANQKAHYERTKQLKGLSRGEHRYNWKGDEASYDSIHSWVERYRGKPQFCEHCKRDDLRLKYEWANVDHRYRRNLEDWIRLCVRCHRWYDQDHELTTASTTCKRCGVPHNERTPGCPTCQKRHAYYLRIGRTLKP